MNRDVSPAALLDDGRALLSAFTAAGWSSVSIELGESRFAFSRDEPRGGLADVAAASDATAAARQAVQICAPHVGTVSEVAEPGRAIESGGWAATITVLGEPFDIAAPQGGTVTSVQAGPGTLVEYGQAIIEISR